MSKILFSLKENQQIPRELWERFAATVRARGHAFGPVFRALMVSYIEKGLPDDTHDAPTGRVTSDNA